MKILVADQFNVMGGAQRCLADLTPALLARGWEIQAALPGEGPMSEYLRSQGIPVHTMSCGPYAFGRKTIADLIRFVKDRRSATHTFRNILEEWRPDILYVNGPRVLPAAAGVAGATPVIFHSHSYPSKRYVRWMLGPELKRCSVFMIGSSEYVASPWRRYAGNERIAVIYNGTPEIPFLARTFPSKAEWRIGIVGRIAPEKGQMEFLRAARILAATGVRARFFVHGAPLLSAPQYAARVRAEGTGVEFTGWHDSVSFLMHDLDLLVVPSPEHESTTRVILEAFSAGTPVVAFASGGIPEVVEHGITGFLAKTRTAEALAVEIRATMLLANELPQVARAARRQWEQRYTLTGYCDQVIEFVESAAARTSGRNSIAASSTNRAAVSNTGA